MPQKPSESERKHDTTLASAVEHVSTLLLFGKRISDLEPSSEGHRFAQIFGFKHHAKCTQLDKPILLSLPEPVGPANECGFNPGEFLMWRVPDSFLTTALHVERAPLTGVLSRQAPPVPAAAPRLLGALAPSTTCVDGVTAINAVRDCQSEVLGRQVSLDTKLSDVLQGASLNQFCACVSRKSAVASPNCAPSSTFQQVARSITCD